jgi:hypothetical protein
MRRRKWLWIGSAALCAIPVVVGYLARPEDELSAALQLQPVVLEGVTYSPLYRPCTSYTFRAPLSLLLSRLPGEMMLTRYSRLTHYEIRLPSGRWGFVEEPPPGEPITLYLWTRARAEPPWYTQAWVTLKHHLGFG